MEWIYLGLKKHLTIESMDQLQEVIQQCLFAASMWDNL